MYLFLKIGIIIGHLLLVIQPSPIREITVKENIVSSESRKLTFTHKSGLVVIGGNQCSRCNSSMIELINKLKTQGTEIVVLRILNSTLMECKEDEYFFKEHFPDVDFEYIDREEVNIYENERLATQIIAEITPVYISLDEEIIKYTSDTLLDEYGRLKKLEN